MRSKKGFPSLLVVSAVPYNGIFNFGKVTPGGTDYHLLTALSYALNFEFTVVTPVDGEWGRETENGSWTGMIGMVSRGEADMALCAIFASKERRRVVDFSWPYMVTDQTFATNLPRRLPTHYAYLYPFDHVTWILIGIVLLVMPVLLRVITHGKYSFVQALFDVYGSLLMRNLGQKLPDVKSLAVFSPFWLFSTWIISFCYMATLPSFLVSPLCETTIRDFRSLAEAVASGEYKAYSYKGSPQTSFMLETGLDHLKTIALAMESQNWFFGPGTAEEHLTEGTAHVEGRLYLQLEYGLPPDSPVFISGDSYGTNYIGIAVGKHFCCKKQLNSAIVRVVETGLFHKYVNDEIFMGKLKFLSKKSFLDESRFRQIALKNVSAAFIVLFLGLSLSILTLLLENCVVIFNV